MLRILGSCTFFTQPGSKAALTAPKSNFRFAPESGLKTDIWPRPKSAITGSEARYSITSSARTRNNSGTVIPIAFAVFRLTTRLNLVGSWTGRSPGFSSLRMRST